MNTKDLKAMEKLFVKAVVEKPEKGFYTARELSKMWNINERTALTRIKRCTEVGLIEVKNFKVKSGMIIRPIPHYRIK